MSVFYKNGTVSTHVVTIRANGQGRAVAPFNSTTVSYVELTLANAGHRFRCWRGTPYSCEGKPLDDGSPASWHAAVVRG